MMSGGVCLCPAISYVMILSSLLSNDKILSWGLRILSAFTTLFENAISGQFFFFAHASPHTPHPTMDHVRWEVLPSVFSNEFLFKVVLLWVHRWVSLLFSTFWCKISCFRYWHHGPKAFPILRTYTIHLVNALARDVTYSACVLYHHIASVDSHMSGYAEMGVALPFELLQWWHHSNDGDSEVC